MATKVVQDGEAIRFGWKKATENLGFLIVVTLGVSVVLFLLLALCGWALNIHWFVAGIFYLIYFAASLYLSIGFYTILLKIIDGKPVSFQDLLVKDLNLLINFGLTNLLLFVMLGIGFLLFILPGLLLMFRFMYAPLLVIDKGMGAIDALKASNQMTEGIRWDLFGFFHVMVFVIAIGVAALFIGALLSIPTGVLAFLYVYRQLANASGVK